MPIYDNYELCANLTEEQLRKFGFKHGTYRCDVYKNLIQFFMYIGSEDDDVSWSYQIQNVDSNSIYIPYYDREYGKNDVVKKVDGKVKKIFDELVRNGILQAKEE